MMRSFPTVSVTPASRNAEADQSVRHEPDNCLRPRNRYDHLSTRSRDVGIFRYQLQFATADWPRTDGETPESPGLTRGRLMAASPEMIFFDVGLPPQAGVLRLTKSSIPLP